MIELFKKEYYESALLKGRMSDKCIKLFHELMMNEFDSHEQMDELIEQIKREHNMIEKTPEQLKIEELEAKLNDILMNI